MDLSVVERHFFSSSPLLIALVVIVTVAAASLAGAWLRQHRDRHVHAKPADYAEARVIVSAVLQLLSLLLGFTLSLAIGGYQRQRSLAVDEANALYAAHLATIPMAEPHRSRTGDLLRQYGSMRIEAATITNIDRGLTLAAKSERIQDKLYETMLDAQRVAPGTITTHALDSVHDLIEIGAERVAARAPVVPSRVRSSLFLFIVIAAGTLSFAFVGGMHKAIHVVLLLFVLAFLLIVDIEHPARGGIMESQSPMKNAIDRMKEFAPLVIGPHRVVRIDC